ncbi:MAG: GNAT family N-acetyltransferase [Oscillospiraceae bacterium]|nr:GNAT family N-acetyltransferase [Oscillospiraceae bacterium]
MITYRKAQPSDMETIIMLRMGYLNETHPDMEKEMSDKINSQLYGYFQEHLNRDIVVYLAESDGKPAGCVFFVLVNKPASPLFITGKTGTLMNVFTLPEYRRMGIGEHLVQMAIDDGSKWDLSYIELRSTKCGYPLYKKTGFAEDKSIYMSMKLFFGNDEGKES